MKKISDFLAMLNEINFMTLCNEIFHHIEKNIQRIFTAAANFAISCI